MIEIFDSPGLVVLILVMEKDLFATLIINLCLTLKKSRVVFINVKLWETEDYYYFAKMMVDNINAKNSEGLEAINPPTKKQNTQNNSDVRYVFPRRIR